MKLHEEFKLYESLWDNTWDKLANVYTMSAESGSEDAENKYIDIML